MKSRVRLVILLVILFLVAHLTFTDRRLPRQALFTDRIIVAIYKPITEVFRAVAGFFTRMMDDYVWLVHVKRENKVLKELLGHVKLENQSLKLQLAQQKDAKAFQEKFSFLGKRWLPVTILGFDPFLPSKTLWIDAGREEGVRVNQVVVCGDGLVGRVIQVFEATSKVLLLIDSQFAVDVINERTRMRALVSGVGSGKLEAKRLPFLSRVEFSERGHEMMPGDRLVTSGLGGLYPKGIPVGRVAQLTLQEGELFEEVLVLPAVDFMKLDSIYVLTDH